jgi:YVTN family beta-propeller protein
VGYDSGNGRLYVTNDLSNNVSVINGVTDRVVGSFPVGTEPYGVAYDSGTGYLYVANHGSNTVSVINVTTDTVVDSVPVGSTPLDMVYDSGNGNLYVTNFNSNNVSVINGATDRVISSLPVGSLPQGVGYDSGTGYLYVTNEGSNNVSVINGANDRVIKSLSVGGTPDGVGYDSGDGYLYVTNYATNNVSVINGVTVNVVGFIPVGTSPQNVVYDSGDGNLYVTNFNSNNVSVINGTMDTVVGSVPVGSEPVGVGYDSGTGYLYVANAHSNNVSVLSDGTHIAPTISSFTAVPPAVSAGQWTNLTVQASGGHGSFTYAYTGLPSGCSSKNTMTLACRPTTARNYAVTVYVNDSFGGSANATTILNVTAWLTSTTVSPSSATLQNGTVKVFSASEGCFGGSCPPGVTYAWSLNNSLGTLNATSGPSVKVKAVANIGTVKLTVVATLGSHTATNSSNITLFPAPLVANVTLSAYRVQNGTPVTATAHLRNAVSPTYAWSLNGTTPLPSCSGSSCIFVLNHAARYEVNLTVKDGNRTAWSQAPLTVTSPLIAGVKLSENDTHPGAEVWVNTTASGGLGPYGYVWMLNKTQSLGTGNSLAYTPHGAGNYTFSVNITDTVGQWVDKQAVLTVLPNVTYLPLTVSLALSTNDTYPGTEVWINATASGGNSVYSYSWTMNGSTYPGSSSSVAFIPKGAGNYTLSVGVSDTVGHSATKGVLLAVLANSTKEQPLTVSLTANATQVHVGASVALTGSASGGLAPYTYAWNLNGVNASSLGTLPTARNLQLSSPGNYTYQLWVTDSHGQVAASNPVTIEVLPASTHSNSASSGIPLWVLLASVAFVAALLLLLFLWVRSRDQREPQRQATTGSSWVAQPIPPAPPAGYMAGITVAPEEWDESAEPSTAYGTYTVDPKEHSEFAEAVRGQGVAPSGGASGTPTVPPELDAYKPFSMEITPDGIRVEEIAKGDATPGIRDAEFSTLSEKGVERATSPLSGPSPADVYAVMQSLARKPRTLDGIKQEVRLDDAALFTVLGALGKARLIARGTKNDSEATVFVLTPLGRKVGRRFLEGEAKKAPKEIPDKTSATSVVRPLVVSSPTGEKVILDEHGKVIGVGHPGHPTTTAPSPPLSNGTHVQFEGTIGPERKEEKPFGDDIKAEDVNPNVQHLDHKLLQPMEMRITQDRGSEVRDTDDKKDADARAKELMDKAEQFRKKRKSKFGLEQTDKPRAKDSE